MSATAASPSPSTATLSHACHACKKVNATKRCSRCRLVWYCSKECQVSDWKTHKVACSDAFQADQHTLHKREFDRIVKHYRLDTDQKSEEIAQFLTRQGDAQDGQVSAPEFAEKFGTKLEEAVVFLEWIKVGVKFKEQAIDTAKKSGFGGGNQ